MERRGRDSLLSTFGVVLYSVLVSSWRMISNEFVLDVLECSSGKVGGKRNEVMGLYENNDERSSLSHVVVVSSSSLHHNMLLSS